jgi:hypothetical protein
MMPLRHRRPKRRKVGPEAPCPSAAGAAAMLRSPQENGGHGGQLGPKIPL